MIELKRKIDKKLIEWKNDPDKLPLIIEGARQIGKTYSILKFGKENYQEVVYLNFVLNPDYIDIFQGSLSVDDIISLITIFIPDKLIMPGKTLIFFDEIQDCPNALVALKSFAIDKRYDVIASGSLLGMATSKHSSFPVGYVKTMEMFAMDFQEFLIANTNEDVITNMLLNSFREKKPIPNALNKKISQLFKKYLIIGGLPRAVTTYLETKDFNKVENIKKDILEGYFKDIAKYGNLAERNKATELLKSIPKQLLNDNIKFQFSKVRKHARARDYEDSLMWLFESGITDNCKRLEEIDPENFDYKISNTNNYRVFIKDPGILITMYNKRSLIKAIINGDYFTNNGAILKNYIFDSLKKQGQVPLYFLKKSGLEIEFITKINDIPIPISLRENINANQALSIFLEENNLNLGLKISENYFSYSHNIYTIPIYSLYLINDLLEIIFENNEEIKKQILNKGGTINGKVLLR